MLPDFWKKFDAPTKALALLPLPMAGVVVFDQWFQWSTKEDYTFGYIVPFFSAYVLYDRFPEIAAHFTPDENRAPEKPAGRIWDILFGVGAFLSLLGFLIGGATRAIGGPNIIATFLNSFGFCGVAAAIVWMISEKDSAGVVRGGLARRDFLEKFTFPILVWIVSGPFLYLVDTQIKYVLLDKVTGVVVALLNAFDYAVTRTANIIQLPGGDYVGVADACSGIRSLTACVFMGAILAALFVNGRVRKLLLLGLAGAFAIVLNVLRTVFLTVWAYKHGSQSLDLDLSGNGPKSPDFALGTVHDLAGYAAMGITFLMLAALVPIINLRLRLPEPPPPPDAPGPDEHTSPGNGEPGNTAG